MYRLFVAVDLPENIKDELGRLSFGLPGARWVAKDQLHLTLRFIGEVDGYQMQLIREKLADINSPSFRLGLKDFGCFPPRKKPKVLWTGIEADEELFTLRHKVEKKITLCGLEADKRKFAPHITLARLNDPPLSRLTSFLAGNGLYATEKFLIAEFHLYSSVLSPKGAIHTCEESYPLF